MNNGNEYNGPTLTHLAQPDPKALAEQPTEHRGHVADCKREEYVDGPDGGLWLVRYWLNRVDWRDGAEWPVEVEVRSCPSGSWRSIGGYGEWPDQVRETLEHR